MLTIVVSTYLGHTPAQLRSFIGSLQAQTRKDFKVVINVDGSLIQKTEQELEHFGANQYKDYHWVKKLDEIIDRDSRFIVKHRIQSDIPFGNFWRSHSLYNDVDTRWINFQNADNQLLPPFVEYMVGEAERADFDLVHCNLVHNYASGPSYTEPYRHMETLPWINRIDYAGYIIKTKVAKDTGMRHLSWSGQDGQLLVDGQNDGFIKTISKCHHILAIHN
jgi:hypothetical protein